MDVEVINKDDVEYYDPQDEIQVSKNAVARLNIITGADEIMYSKKPSMQDLGSAKKDSIYQNGGPQPRSQLNKKSSN